MTALESWLGGTPDPRATCLGAKAEAFVEMLQPFFCGQPRNTKRQSARKATDSTTVAEVLPQHYGSTMGSTGLDKPLTS